MNYIAETKKQQQQNARIPVRVTDVQEDSETATEVYISVIQEESVDHWM